VILNFALCHGAEIRLCSTCDRLTEHHPRAAEDPFQPFVTPANSGERCPRWKPRPAPLTPRIDTGD
jgi:hypothetical protein